MPIYTLNSDRENGLHLAMKLIRGENFKNLLDQVAAHYRRDGAGAYDEEKSLRYRLDVFLKVCDALEYAHSRNVMHCDLKPENIMIGEYHETYVMDWGIARPIREDSSEPDAPEWKKRFAGTPRYLSPEAIRREPCDQRADIFSMGVILFETVTLKDAFSGTTLPELLGNIRDGRMESLDHAFGVRIDGDLAAIIRKAVANRPEERYAGIGELSQDLRRYLMGAEVSANPDNLPMKCARWLYRHRRLTLVAVLATLLAGTGALAFSLYREYRFSELNRKRDFALSMAYSISARAGYQLDKQFSKLEQTTGILAADIQFLLDHDIHRKNESHGAEPAAAHSVRELRRNPPAAMISSTFHRGKIDPAALVWNATPDTAPERIAERVETIGRFIPRLLQTILTSPVNTQIAPERMEEAFRAGTPIIRVLFGFPDGLYAAYPASAAFPEIYDPRKRLWYRQAEQSQAGEAIWSVPYPDSIPELGLVISCSVPLRGKDGRDNGVCAIDISLPELIEELHSSGNSGDYVIEKAIVDNQGRLIVSTTANFADARLYGAGSAGEEPSFPPMADRALLADMKDRKFGVRAARDPSGEMVIYAFNHIRSVDWFYIEKLRYDRTLEQFTPARAASADRRHGTPPAPQASAVPESAPATPAGR